MRFSNQNNQKNDDFQKEPFRAVTVEKSLSEVTPSEGTSSLHVCMSIIIQTKGQDEAVEELPSAGHRSFGRLALSQPGR